MAHFISFNFLHMQALALFVLAHMEVSQYLVADAAHCGCMQICVAFSFVITDMCTLA
jgi:hypothetical protein